MERKIKVKLTTDLTKYAKGLIAGSEGYTVGNQGIWSRGSDRFVTVCFPHIATLDVLWKSLDIIDETVLAENEKYEKEFIESLKSAHDVTLNLGPLGGFRNLSLSYYDKETGTSIHHSIGFREEAYRVIDILKSYTISITEIRAK